MAVDQKIAAVRVLVLANARGDERRHRERRESSCNVLTNLRGGPFTYRPVARFGIETGAQSVKADLHAMLLGVRTSIRHTWICIVDPSRHTRRTKIVVRTRHSEKEQVLACRRNQVAQNAGKQLGKPGAARKDE